MPEQKLKESKGTMTDILSMRTERPAQLKPLKPTAPRMRDFTNQDKQRQSDLGDQDMKLARRVWRDYVEPVKEEFITTVFNQFFLKHPHLTDLFLRLESVGLPRLALPKDMKFKSYHLARIMLRLRGMMDSMDQPQRLTKLMTRLGVLHARMGLDTQESVLDDFQEAIVSTIRMVMRGNMLAAEEVALRKCLEMAFSIMQEASFTYYDLFVNTTSLKGKAGRL